MRIQQTFPAGLSRKLAEWRLPLDADPDVDAAVMRMLGAFDRYLQRQQEPQERKV